MTFIKTLTLILSLIILESCGSSQNSSNASENFTMKDDPILSGNYSISTLIEKSVAMDLSIEFDAETNKVSGFSGCNRFFGNFKTEGNTISFNQLASTKKLCRDENNAVESKMMAALGKVNTFEFKDEQLLLKNDDQVLIVSAEENSEEKKLSDIILTYEANTRGFYEKIWVKHGQLSFTNDRLAKAVETHPVSKNDMKILLDYTEEIDPKSLPDLEAPSKAFQYDGAAIATLKIENSKDSYITSAFDHGNPPQAIKALVEKLLSVKEEMAK